MTGSPPAPRPPWYRAPFNRIAGLPPTAILALLTAMIVAIGLLLAQSTFAQRAARRSAQNEGNAALALQALQQSLVDAETGQRGFLLTRDPAYLAPYDAARRRIPDQIATVKLQFGTDSDAAVDARLQKIDALFRDKFTELDQTVTYARAGDADAALALVRTNTGRATMDALRGELDALAIEQRQRRAAAFAAAERVEGREVPLLLGLWAGLILLVWAAVRGERRRAMAEEVARQAERLHEANQRSVLLAQELNHRVKNLFGVVLSLVGIAGREKGETREVIADLSDRIHALARAHAIAFGGNADDVTELRTLLTSVLAPYQDAEGARIGYTGGACGIAAQQVTPLSLVLHELATNAAKYGALSAPDGQVAIGWTDSTGDDAGAETTMTWCESGGPRLPPQPDPAAVGGFGTRMIEAVLRQIEGSIEREWRPEGAVVTLRFHRALPLHEER